MLVSSYRQVRRGASRYLHARRLELDGDSVRKTCHHDRAGSGLGETTRNIPIAARKRASLMGWSNRTSTCWNNVTRSIFFSKQEINFADKKKRTGKAVTAQACRSMGIYGKRPEARKSRSNWLDGCLLVSTKRVKAVAQYGRHTCSSEIRQWRRGREGDED